MGEHVINNIETMRKMEEDNMVDGMWGGTEEKQDRKRNHKGFTLVELIVVIVILAILAAILIPGLLKWIDEARLKKYEMEARNIYQAAEAEATKLYARNGTRGDEIFVAFNNEKNTEQFDRIKELTGIETIESVTIGYEKKDSPVVIWMYADYTSSDGQSMYATWNIKNNSMFHEMFKDSLKGSEDGWAFCFK